MRTTIDIPNIIFREVKAASALKGITLKEFINKAIEKELKQSLNLHPGKRIELPLIPSKNPSSLDLTSDKIASYLEMDDLRVSS